LRIAAVEPRLSPTFAFEFKEKDGRLNSVVSIASIWRRIARAAPSASRFSKAEKTCA
jgi:hypothetical protein